MKNVLTLTAILLATTGARANDLQGVWKMNGQQCQSGAPSKGFGDHLIGKIDGIAVITADQLKVKMQVSYKYEQRYAEEAQKQLQNALKQWDQLPDSPEKQKSVAELKSTLDVTAKFAAGVQCTVREVRSYSVSGATIRSNYINSSSTCPGNDTSQNSSATDESTFELDGDVLKVTPSKAEMSDSGSCPKGDHTVTLFKRIK